MTLTLQSARGEWVLAEADEKLAFRASLPGAFGYDQAAQVLRTLQADGYAASDLLPLAFPTSWMVNAKATSRAFRAWLVPPARAIWQALLVQLESSMSLEQWRTIDGDERDAIAANVARLSSMEGASVSAVSKVLALLRPQLIPLMDDAAIAFAIGAVEQPSEETATAGPEVFLPMVDWFAEQVIRAEPDLIAIAARHRQAVLDAPQVLDRLLWMDAWGERYRRKTK
jgi:hypothetical protein